MRGEKQKKQRSLSSVNSIFFSTKKKSEGQKKETSQEEGGVIKLKAVETFQQVCIRNGKNITSPNRFRLTVIQVFTLFILGMFCLI